MLTPFDDYPCHQIPSTFDHAESGDPRWFDRYWFLVYLPDEQLTVASGLSFYKNMNVADGFASMVVDKKQRNLRVSRRLRPNFNIGVGPLRYEVIEGLQSIRLVLDENAYGISFDLTWDGAFPPQEEAHNFIRVGGMVKEDYQRFYQHGTVNGRVTVDEKVYESATNKWWGFRDRSFGVRPTMGGTMPTPAPPASAKRPKKPLEQFACMFANDEVSGQIRLIERPDGSYEYFSGHIIYPATDGRKSEKMTLLKREVKFVPGTYRLDQFSLSFKTESGEIYEVEGDRLTEPFIYEGLGYQSGFHDNQPFGVYRGDDHIEGENYDLSNINHVVDESGRRKFEVGDGLCDYATKVTINGKPGFAETCSFVPEENMLVEARDY